MRKKSQKKRNIIKVRYVAGKSGRLTYQNVYIIQTNNMWKFGEDTTLQTWMLVNFMN